MKTTRIANDRIRMMQRQRGASPLTVIVGLSLLLGVIMVMVKIVPVYIDDQAVKSAFENLTRDPDVLSMSDYEIREKVATSLRINNVRSFDLDNIKVARESRSRMVVSTEYSVTREIAGNLSALMVFEHSVEVTRP